MKTNLSVVAQATISLAAIANSIGVMLGELKSVEAKAETLKGAINKKIAELHKAKATVGIYKKDGTGCATATAFIDGCVASGIALGTAQKVYLPTFKKAVASGKPVSDWNSQRNKGNKAKGEGKSELSSLFVKAFNHDEGKSFVALCATIEKGFEDAKFDSIYDGFVDYLKSEGFDIKS